MHTNKFSLCIQHKHTQIYNVALIGSMLLSYWLELSHAGFLLAVAQSLPANPLGSRISPWSTDLTQTLGVNPMPLSWWPPSIQSAHPSWDRPYNLPTWTGPWGKGRWWWNSSRQRWSLGFAGIVTEEQIEIKRKKGHSFNSYKDFELGFWKLKKKTQLGLLGGQSNIYCEFKKDDTFVVIFNSK